MSKAGPQSLCSGIDWCGRGNAIYLASKIEKYWADKGHKVSMFVDLLENTKGTGGNGAVYQIRSNMIGGLPRENQ